MKNLMMITKISDELIVFFSEIDDAPCFLFLKHAEISNTRNICLDSKNYTFSLRGDYFMIKTAHKTVVFVLKFIQEASIKFFEFPPLFCALDVIKYCETEDSMRAIGYYWEDLVLRINVLESNNNSNFLVSMPLKDSTFDPLKFEFAQFICFNGKILLFMNCIVFIFSQFEKYWCIQI